MNYQILKTILDSLVSNFKCPTCNSWVTDKNVEILWTANQSINLEIICPECNKPTMVKAEMANFNVWNLPNLTPQALQDLKAKLKNTSKTQNAKINEKEIIDLKNTLNQDNLWASDFLRWV